MTWHLNLKWTVADMDRLEFARWNAGRMTIHEMSLVLKCSPYPCPEERLKEICASFGVRARKEMSLS